MGWHNNNIPTYPRRHYHRSIILKPAIYHKHSPRQQSIPLPLYHNYTTRQLTTKNSRPSPTSNTSASVWKQFKAPALFGVGLYLGLMLFGEHRETKEGSAYFDGLRAKFWGIESGGGNVRDDNGDNGKKN